MSAAAALVLAPSLLWAARAILELLLGRLAGWAIAKTPKAFRWTIARITVRPSLSWSNWSEIALIGWTWHNPAGFEDDKASYILQIDRLTLRLELLSVYRAIRYKEAIVVDLLLVEGLRFRALRNREDALNLWEALDLPDQDVNVSAIVRHARDHGGLQASGNGDEEESPRQMVGRVRTKLQTTAEAVRSGLRQLVPVVVPGGGPLAAGLWRLRPRVPAPMRRIGTMGFQDVVPLPSLATVATRRAAGLVTNISPDAQRRYALGHCCLPPLCSWTRTNAKDAAEDNLATGLSGPAASSSSGPLPPEYPVGHPRRRPRWGVPVRFDIRQLVSLGMELWVLDLMTAAHDTHESKIEVASLVISRERLEAGDERRSGGADGVRGVFLGELVGVMIAKIVPIIIKRSPSRLLKNALLATGSAIKGTAARFGAGALQLALSAEQSVYQEVAEWRVMQPAQMAPPRSIGGCRLLVHLITGRRITRNFRRVNASAQLELRDVRPGPHEDHVSAGPGSEPSSVVDAADSALRLWTTTPHWDDHFDLGPVPSRRSFLRVAFFHHKAHHAIAIDSASPMNADMCFIGEVMLQISALLVRFEGCEEEIVGWFPLTDSRGLAGGARCTGMVKLGLRLGGVRGLPPAG